MGRTSNAVEAEKTILEILFKITSKRGTVTSIRHTAFLGPRVIVTFEVACADGACAWLGWVGLGREVSPGLCTGGLLERASSALDGSDGNVARARAEF